MTSSHKNVHVSIAPHPFAVERITKTIPAGQSVADIVRSAQPDVFLQSCAHVTIGGQIVLRAHWERVYPKPGVIVCVRMVPMGGGGGGKSPLRTVLTLAIAVASPMIASGLASAMGATTTFMGIGIGNIATAGVNLLGRLALNAIAPPPKPRLSGAGQKDSPTMFIQGARNQVTPFGRVPKVLGRHRMVPPMGALPYTETVGNDQYLRMLFVWGYGPLEISDLKIGETALSEFDDVQIETRLGYDDDAPITLYSNAVLQNDLQVELRQEAGYVLRTTETDADEISVDVTFPHGLFAFDGNNNKIPTEARIEVQYAPTGTSEWSAGALSYMPVASKTVTLTAKPAAYAIPSAIIPVTRIDRIVMDKASGAIKVIDGTPYRWGLPGGSAQPPAVPAGYLAIAQVERRSDDTAIIPSGRITDERVSAQVAAQFQNTTDFAPSAHASADKVTIAAGGLRFDGIYVKAKQTTALRKSVRFQVPRGQYDVRLRRLTADAQTDDIFDQSVWTALRTMRDAAPVRMQGIAMTALRIKASEQLSGMIDRFNGVVHSILPDWDGENWIEQVTSNPASLFRHVLQGVGNARPLADARVDMARLQDWHERCAQENRQFNAIIDYNVSVREVLQDIAALGRASPAVIDGKWAVIEDRAQDVPVQHFTPRNTFGFQGQKAFDAPPHALRARFINAAKGWVQDERLVFADGYDATTAQRYETLELTGITDGDQAWRDGRYHMAVARLRPETFIFHADLEHIVCVRGDMVRLTHDVPLFGLHSARIAQITEADGQITMLKLDAYMTMVNGTSYSMRIRTAAGASIVVGVDEVTGKTPYVTLLESLPSDCGLAVGDLVMFGESGQESVELVVRAIEPQGDLTARLTCVDAAPEIYSAETGVIPPHQSHITLPPEMQRPPAPVLTQVQSGEEVLLRNTDGSFTTRIVMTLAQPVWPLPLDPLVQIKSAGESDYRPAEFSAIGAQLIAIAGVEEGETYDIRVRYKNAAGVSSAALVISGHRVAGTSALPADVEGFALKVMGDSAHFSWQKNADIDLQHYVMRYSPLTTGAAWSGAIDVIANIPPTATSTVLPAACGTYLIKAVDVGGRQSENAAAAITTVAGLAGYNAVESLSLQPDFSGTRDDMCILDGGLMLAPDDILDDCDDLDMLDSFDMGAGGLAVQGQYTCDETLDLGAVYTSRLIAALEVYGLDLNASIDLWTCCDDLENWDENVDPSLWTVTLEIRTTQDDPAASPVWSSWAPFIVGDYTARAFEFRIAAQSNASGITPVITAVNITVDMPDRIAAASAQISDVAGSDVTFTRAFRAVPALAITAQNMATGDYYTITGQDAEGFHIRFFNAAGSGVSRTFDYVAKGYGEIQT